MNVYIGGTKDYSAMQGPAPSGFHVPLRGEWQGLRTIMNGLGLTTGDNWRINLHMPFAGLRLSSGNLYNQGSRGSYMSSSPFGDANPNDAMSIVLSSSSIYGNNNNIRAMGQSVRCFKNSFELPTASWTVINGTLGGAGIFRDTVNGLISITGDGTTGYTIQDKNLGATTVYNNGDTLTQANMGNMYQWGNNYGFPSTGSVTTSSTQVDASSYGPGNYYSSSTFITGSDDWSSVHNDNLRGGVTGIVSPAELKNDYIGEYRVGNTYPGAIEKTSDMVYDIDFSGGNIVDKCGLSITNSGVTTINDANNYVGVLNGSSQINLNSTTVYSKTTAMFYSMWIKIPPISGRLLDLHNGYSEMLIGFYIGLPNGFNYGREEANRGGSGTWQETGFDLNDWHLVQMRYDGSSTTYLYVDGEYKTSVSNTYSGYGNTGTGQMIGSSNGSGYVVGYIGQCYARTTRPSDSEILEEYNYTRPR